MVLGRFAAPVKLLFILGRRSPCLSFSRPFLSRRLAVVALLRDDAVGWAVHVSDGERVAMTEQHKLVRAGVAHPRARGEMATRPAVWLSTLV
jgi:hypothetical protein